MKIKYKRTRFITFISFTFAFLFVFATIATAFNISQGNSLKQDNTATSSANGKARGRDKMEDRLSEVKLKICEKKESSIQKRSTKLVTKAENIQTRFDRIIKKVDTYYVDVLVPKGVEVENYQELLSNIEENRVAAAAALGVAESAASNFTCEGVDPKDQISQFRTDIKSVISTLQGYKKSVVNLIVAVRTKAKNVKDPVATSSAQPATESATPE